jgi:hypothetical protein
VQVRWLADQEYTGQVDCHVTVPLFDRAIEDAREVGYARIQVDCVESSERGEGALDHSIVAMWGRDVSRQGER